MKTTSKDAFEGFYNQPDAVWTRKDPPAELVKLVEKEIIKPCKTLDVACGEGFYSIYLAEKGFDVLGIDFSKRAIDYAKNNAEQAGVDARFAVMDVQNLNQLKEKFDFVFEWGLLHHLKSQGSWEEYVENISNLLNKGGKYLSLCFNDSSPEYNGTGSGFRSIPSELKVYHSTQEELRKLFKPHFKIIDEKLIHIHGIKSSDHICNYFLMEKL